jgi:predicted DNA binding CopG/RHH family protein
MTEKVKRQATKGRIPEFASLEEEAEFWDTHDLADYWDEFKPVKVHFAKRLSEGITIRFDPETLKELRARAREKGLGPTTLARMWILERLQEVGEQSPSPERRE